MSYMRLALIIGFVMMTPLGLHQGRAQMFTPPFSSFAPDTTSIVSHYPESAYTTQRLLPFAVLSEEAGVEVTSARVTRGEGCQALIDPFHPQNFHLHCREPGVVVAEVMFNVGSRQNLIFILGPFQIRDLRTQQGGGNAQ